MEIDSNGRFLMNATDKPSTPKRITMSGDIGHILYVSPDITLDGIVKVLLEEKGGRMIGNWSATY